MPYPKGKKQTKESIEKRKRTMQYTLLNEAKQKYKGKQTVGNWESFIDWDTICLKRIKNRTRRFVSVFCGRCKNSRWINFHNLVKQMRKPYYTGCCKKCIENMTWLERGRPRPTKRKPMRGYMKLYMPENPMADKRGEVYEHRLVMSQIVGRPLKKWEIVQHIDGNRANNSPDNLRLYPKKSGEHLAFDRMRYRIKELEALLTHHNIPIP